MAEIIVTGVDDSQPAMRAAEQAATLATALEAKLYVVSAFSANVTDVSESIRYQGSRTAMANALNELVGHHAGEAKRTASEVAGKLGTKFPQLLIASEAVEGSPGAALIRKAEELDASIIVVGNKRVQGPGRILGSIARAVASEANCDLYVVNTHPR